MKALQKTFRIVDALEASGPCELGTIADRTDLPRSTVHHHLSALEENGFVVNSDGTYRLALRFLDLGEEVRRRTELFQIAKSEIDELADRIAHPVNLFVAENDRAVVLYTHGENPAIPISLYPGQHIALHATAAGKVLLSIRDGAFDEQLRPDALRSFTEHTITDPERLTAVLREATDQGYATARQERWRGRAGLAVPLTPGGKLTNAAIEVALEPEAFDDVDREELAAELQQTANVIDIKSDYSS